MGETWRYRYPITNFVQQAMLRKVSTDGPAALVDDERILLTVSTFWSATARGELHAWFRSDPGGRTRDALRALTAIGAISMAGIVRANADRIARTISWEQFGMIEEALLRSEDQIEELTARYAARTAPGDDTGIRQADSSLI
jgi:hypothetical protein